MARSETLPSTLTYRLLPTPADVAAIHDMLRAYRRMLAILHEIRLGSGLRANVVALTERSYQRLRDETGLPARTVTLGIREFAQTVGIDPESVDSMPLDDKLFSVKSGSEIALTTLSGRRTLAYHVEGYGGPWRGASNARLIIAGDVMTIEVGVSVAAPNEETRIMPENILTRVGRIIGGISNAALDAVEDRNSLATAQQALREIDEVIDEARLDLGKIKAEDHRLNARRGQLDSELKALPAKLRTALSGGREDLARSGIARQIDLESQIEAIDSSLASVGERHEAASKALQAATAARRDAEHRIALLRQPTGKASDALADYGDDTARTRRLEQSLRAIDRLTGTPSAVPDGSVEDLDRLHRDHAIEERLAALKQADSA